MVVAISFGCTIEKEKSRVRFTIRVWLLVVLGASVALCWFSSKIRESHRVHDSAEAIKNCGGIVLYQYEVDYLGRPTGMGKPRGPSWLRWMLSDDFCNDIAVVDLRGAWECPNPVVQIECFTALEHLAMEGNWLEEGEMAVIGQFGNLRTLRLVKASPQAGFQALSRLHRLERLSLVNSAICDEDLAYISDLAHLQELRLDGTAIGDVGLEHVSKLTNLEVLSVAGTKVTAQGLTRLHGMSELRELYLAGTALSSPSLVSLAAMPHLQVLDLGNTQVNDAELVHLSPMRELQSLNLAFTCISDAGLVNLTNLSELRVLDISGTNVTDSGVVHLVQLRGLRELSVWGTRLTGRGMRALADALPEATRGW